MSEDNIALYPESTRKEADGRPVPLAINTRKVHSRRIRLYDAEKNAAAGNGGRVIVVTADTPEELNEKIRQLKEEQDNRNAMFRAASYHAKLDRKLNAKISIKEERMRAEMESIVQIKQSQTQFKLHLDKGTGNTLFILGSSKAGKSHTLMYIYDHYYSPSVATDPSNYKWISVLWTCNPQVSVYRNHRKLLIAPTWNAEGEDVIAAMKKIQTGTKCAYKFLNMFDDVLNVRDSKLLNNLILSYRNAKMSSIISIQYVFMLTKAMRTNINSVILHAFNTDEGIEAVISIFLKGYLHGLKMPKSEWIPWYKKMTADHAFIYVKPSEGIVSFHRLAL